MAIVSDKTWGNPQDPYNAMNGGMGGVPELMAVAGAGYDARNREIQLALQRAGSPVKQPTAPGGPGGGSGRYGRGGGGGGGGSRVRGLEFYRAGAFRPGNLMAQARKELNTRLAENKRQTNVARGQARLETGQTMAELQRVRGQSLGNVAAQQGQEYGRLNNISMNRGMGYGEGAGANYVNLAQQSSERRGGVEGTYGAGVGQAQNQLANQLASYDEADRAFSASLPGLTNELYRTLYNEAYQQWYNQQQLALDAIQQRNQARTAMAG